MKKSQPKKHRGRPPKYVKDPKGREIVGLSYHKAVGQYYLTFSSPRIYLGNDKKKAVETFLKNKEYTKLPLEAQEEAKRKDEIYRKALELLDYDECLQEKLQQKARKELDKIFLQEASYISEIDKAITKAIRKHLSNPSVYHTKSYISDNLYYHFAPKEIRDCEHNADSDISYDKVAKFIGNLVFNHVLKNTIQEYSEKDLINEAVKKVVDEKIREEAEKFFDTNKDSLVWERAYDLILENPIKAAMITGIKELAYLALCPSEEDRSLINSKNYRKYPMPLPWWLVWEIYIHHNNIYGKIDEVELEIQESIWKHVGVFLDFSRNVEAITEKEVRDALNFNYLYTESLEKKYRPYIWAEVMSEIKDVLPLPALQTSSEVKQEALIRVTRKVLELGYQQCSNLFNILKLSANYPPSL